MQATLLGALAQESRDGGLARMNSKRSIGISNFFGAALRMAQLRHILLWMNVR
jgi:hypothetical protein